MARGTDPKTFVEECKTFISQCQQRLPGARIIFLSIKPSPSRMIYWKNMERANQLLEDLCNLHENVYFADISTPMFEAQGQLKKDIYAEDRLHLNDRGYSLLKEVILGKIIQSMN
jgi:lysophospholipase L1-like esterase